MLKLRQCIYQNIMKQNIPYCTRNKNMNIIAVNTDNNDKIDIHDLKKQMDVMIKKIDIVKEQIYILGSKLKKEIDINKLGPFEESEKHQIVRTLCWTTVGLTMLVVWGIRAIYSA